MMEISLFLENEILACQLLNGRRSLLCINIDQRGNTIYSSLNKPYLYYLQRAGTPLPCDIIETLALMFGGEND